MRQDIDGFYIFDCLYASIPSMRSLLSSRRPFSQSLAKAAIRSSVTCLSRCVQSCTQEARVESTELEAVHKSSFMHAYHFHINTLDQHLERYVSKSLLSPFDGRRASTKTM
jgi:hypothetical protein